jgi:hypothetical protein
VLRTAGGFARIRIEAVAAPISQIKSIAILEAAVASAAEGAGSPFVGLQSGAEIAARVVALLEDGQVQLAIGNALLTATTEIALSPGDTVRFAVQNTAKGIALRLIDQLPPEAATAQAANAQAVAPEGVQIAITVPPAGRTVAMSAPGEPNTGAVSSAPSSAPPGPTVAAPLATAGAASEATAPAPLVTAADLPLAAAPPLAPASGIDAAAALEAAVRTAAATQVSLSPLFAEIAAAVDLPALPGPLQREALQLLSLRPSLDGNLTAEDIKQALGKSGLFFEARIAESAQPSSHELASPGTGSAADAAPLPMTGNAQPAGDLKAALVVFRQVLAMALAEGDGAETILASSTITKPVPVPAPASMSAPLPIRPTLPAPAVSGAPAASAGTAPALRTTQISPPPPFRNGPVTAQPPVIATIDATTPPHVAVQTLMTLTDGALARQTLLQAASLPSPPAGHQDSGGPRWNFEVPFGITQGPHIATNVVQFEISRDGRAATPADETGPVWRARFSVAIDPIGRVHAQIGLRGVRTAVTLWAEDPQGAARLRAGAAKLADALRAAELDPADLVVRDGTPRIRAVAAGHFLDRAS